jgi:hypothetical protein
MKLQITFLDESVVEIFLFQNNAVTKWFKHFQKINLDHTMGLLDLRDSNDTINSSEYWNQIKSAIDKLKQINYTFPFLVSDEFDRSQDTLNQLHRFFTYNVLWYHDLSIKPDKKNPFDENFKIPEYMSFQQWLDIVDEINLAVHKLQSSCYTNKNRKFILDQHPLSMICSPVRKSHTDLNTWLQFTIEDQAHNFEEYMALELPMVTLDDSILGKSVLQSFYENDDPNAQDCTGRLGSFGGFVIELDDTRKNIYRSTEFTSWAKSHNRALDSLPLEFPIGYIPDFENQRSTLLQKMKIYKNTKFID